MSVSVESVIEILKVEYAMSHPETIPSVDPLEQIPVAEPVRPKDEDAVVKTLRRVRTRLEHHWTIGHLYDGKGNYCLLGAVMKETIGFTPRGGSGFRDEWKYWVPKLSRNYRRTTRALRHAQGFHTNNGLTMINDRRGKGAVLDLIDRTIAVRKG